MVNDYAKHFEKIVEYYNFSGYIVFYNQSTKLNYI